MRDLLITAIVFGSLPWILMKPHIGILMWSWLGYMNPHRLAWGFAYSLPFASLVALVTMAGIVFSKEPKRIPVNGLTVVWCLFILWMGISTLFAIFPEYALPQFEKVIKIQLVTFLTLMLMCSKERLNLLVWIIVLSIGFFGVKGGIFAILTGGNYRVWGPPGSFISDNNALALALLMILPLMYYLRHNSENKWVRLGFLAAMLSCSFAIVSSHSRGAFLAGFCMAFFLWLKSKHKISLGMGLLITISLLLAFMPSHWFDRMETIKTYQEDKSAMGRINAWKYSINVASDRLTGAGFESWSKQTFLQYVGNDDVHAAHSIYFGVLGDHGWIGLILFFAIGVMAWRTGSWIIRHSKGHDELKWLSDLARMIQVSLVAYASGGAFLSLAYYDLYWHLVAILVLGKVLTQQHLKETTQKTAFSGQWAMPAPASAGGNSMRKTVAMGNLQRGYGK